MKKTFLFSAVLLFSAASFAQTSVKNSEAVKHQTSVESNGSGSQVNASANASSTSAIHSNAVNAAKKKSHAEIKKEKKALAAEKQAQAAEANNKGQMISGIASGKTASLSGSNKGEVISGIASEGRSVSASANSQTKANLAAGHNNLSDNASLNSSAEVKHRRKQIKNEEKETREVSGDAIVKSNKHVKTRLNKKTIQAHKKISATTANVAEVTNAVRPKPVSVKTGAQVRTSAAIKIR